MVCHDNPFESRMEYQCQKICNNSNQNYRISRDPVGYREKHQKPSRAKNSQNKETNNIHTREKQMELELSKDNFGPSKLRHFCCPSRKTTLSYNTNRSKSPSRRPQKQNVLITDRCHTGTELVDEQPVSEFVNSSQRPHCLHNNRCFRPRLGSHSQQQENERYLDSTTTVMAQQPERTMDIERSYATGCLQLQTKNNLSSNRQQICRSVYHQRRRDQISTSSALNTRHFRDSSTIPDPYHSSVPSRKVQPNSRQSFSILPNTRMDAVRTRDSGHIQKMGDTINRPFCKLPVSGCGMLCKRGCMRPSQCVCKRFQPTLELQFGLDFPPTFAYTTHSPTSTEELRSLSASNTKVGENLLESGVEAESNVPTIQNLESAQTSSGSENWPTSTNGRKNSFAGLEGSGWTNLLESWDKEDILLLESAWRYSTLKTYKSAWVRWCSWAKGKCLVNDPTPEDVAKFIIYLHKNVKLSPSTIAVHKSVVLVFANPLKSTSLADHPLIKQTLKAITLTKPPTRKPSVWNVGDLIEYLQHYHINVASIFQVSRHVAALLLLCTGRRIHDLTLLDISTDNYESTDEYVILWPKFGSKTDSRTYRQAGWQLKNSGQEKLNPVIWIKRLVSLSESRRKARNDLNSLFITTRGKVKAASKTVIAGWIKTLFRQAGIRSSPGSFRAAVNSDMWINGNVNIDQILIKANWQSKDTFLKHYFKEIKKCDRRSDKSNNSLTELFTPL